MTSIMVQAITGFNHLAYYESKVNDCSPNCTICRRPLKMTTEHLFTECEALINLRLRVFGHHCPQVNAISVVQLVRFLKEANVDWLPFENA